MDPQTQPPPAAPPDDAVGALRRRGLIFIGAAVAGVGFAMAVQMGAQANFVGEEMGIEPFYQGLLESIRESCGIVALGVVALLAGLAEPLVASGMLVLVGVGLGAYAFVPDYAWLIVASLVWSQGLHVWMPLPQSMTLALAEPGRAGHRLGQIRSAGAIGAGAGLIAGYVLHEFGVQIRPLYLIGGAVALLAAGMVLGVPRRIKTPGPRLVFRRKYALYYVLCFLEGWRKQIFVAFAGYLLVRVHGVSLSTMLLLAIAIHAIFWLAAPAVGRLIDRVGERPVLVIYFAGLSVCFACYALIPAMEPLCAVYVIDSALFVFSTALTTYVNRIAPPAEHTPTLSMGVAMNHIAAVTMPLVGGLLWRYAGYQWVFALGAAVAAASIIPALRVPPRDAGEAPQGP